MSTPHTLVMRLLRLAWPVALARLGIMGMGVADVVVVGQLAPNELPDQALGWAPTGVFLVAGIGLLTGVQVLAARAMGAGSPADARSAWQRGLVVSAAAGLVAAGMLWLCGAQLFTAFGIAPRLAEPAADVMRILALSVPLHLAYCATAFFLEAIQRPLPSTIVMWGANLLNLALDLWLVPQFGAVGSAWATVGSRAALAGVLIVWVLATTDRAGGATGRRATDPATDPTYRRLLRIGFAAALSQAAEAGAFSAMTIIAGRIGDEAVAAYQILLNLLAVVFMVALGLATATAVLTSDAVGRRAPSDAARASWTGLAVCALVMAVLGAAAWLGAAPIARLYTGDVAIMTLAASLMGLAGLIVVPDGAQGVAAHALRARGDNWFPTASHVLAYVFVMPPLAFWLGEVLGRGVAGLLQAILWASVLSIGVLTARLWWIGRRGGTRQSFSF